MFVLVEIAILGTRPTQPTFPGVTRAKLYWLLFPKDNKHTTLIPFVVLQGERTFTTFRNDDDDDDSFRQTTRARSLTSGIWLHKTIIVVVEKDEDTTRRSILQDFEL